MYFHDNIARSLNPDPIAKHMSPIRYLSFTQAVSVSVAVGSQASATGFIFAKYMGSCVSPVRGMYGLFAGVFCKHSYPAWSTDWL